MKLTRHDLEDQAELMQDDLMCVLDGIEDSILTNACQVIVDRMQILINKFDGD